MLSNELMANEEKSNQAVCEAYFKARGWEFKSTPMHESFYWEDADLNSHGDTLPNILESFPDFKREVLEVMRKEGKELEVKRCKNGFFMVFWDYLCREKIINDEILKAAVIAATRYWESKENEEGS